MNKLIMLAFFTIGSLLGYSQTATIKAPVTYPYIEDTAKTTFNRFTINGHSFGEKDTVIKIRINPKGFDSCEAVIARDTLRFVTKFKSGELYEIEQGCCCAAFTLRAKNNAARGTVMFKNTTGRDLAVVVAEANIDTVKKSRTHTTFASESAMCLFKPCSILITETEYLSSKYDYQSDNRDYDKLWEEQAKYILASTWFNFLHGEKIEVIYDEKTKTAKPTLTGYLTEGEHRKWRGF
jgi:hypothetical protein